MANSSEFTLESDPTWIEWCRWQGVERSPTLWVRVMVIVLICMSVDP
jgi:hypothetical protein